MSVRVRKPKAIIMDIEGTTTSSTFVSDSLFPFIRRYLKQYLVENWNKNELMLTIEKLRNNSKVERSQGSKVPLIFEEDKAEPEQIIKSVITNVLWQIDEKKRSTALQEIQLLVWVYGYEQGLLEGQ